MSFRSPEPLFWRVYTRTRLFYLIAALAISGCQPDSTPPKAIVDKENDSIPELKSPANSHKKALLSPHLLWKSYVGDGSIQLLLSEANRDVYYLESRSPSGKELLVLAMDRRNGRKLYETRDRLSPFSKPLMTRGILYYAGDSGYLAVDLSLGKKLIVEKAGVCHPILPLDKEDSSLLLEKVSPAKARQVLEHLCVDVRTKSVIWRKAGSDGDVLVGKKYIAFQKADSGIDVVERSSGRLSHSVNKLITTLHQDKEAITIQNDYL
ncbi:MAG: hypothetical protein OEZ36_03655, partial [Spirochaetota bacterium]|nr:hypothetical protein [Spirochaetota bacterium]